MTTLTRLLLAVVACGVAGPAAVAAEYVLRRTYDAANFADSFAFRTAADFADLNGDPTNGFVNYVDVDTAADLGLFRVINVAGDASRRQQQVFLGVDNTSTLSTRVQGRNSLRLESFDTFDRGLLVADIAHMPGNQCGVWPAFWTYNFAEEPMGEIDVIEGINHQKDNTISLHTCDRCKFTGGDDDSGRHDGGLQPDRRSTSAIMTGRDLRSNCALGGDCDENAKNWDGCGVTASEAASYGDGFNAAGGGVYVLQLTSTFMKIWHYPRSAIPDDLAAGTPDPSGWGLPMGAFEQKHGGCDVGGIFRNQTIIINIDFCGDNESDDIWQTDRQCSQYSSCTDFVAKHPAKFAETYWLFNSIKLYKESD
ncbi:glycoside hydrolase family 16 protein [Niveomyces insectorum RCEF 264]|uniref:Glycoside hydrolase family 16 protein n=1 Tax=Niveomyces insectorum RCEF 264 TaxID=1081102 RepID=A0A167P2C7_9HYPO|nr:glycoside hydrolase family 16 protein [Niveomyces insectorum RCEF 264]